MGRVAIACEFSGTVRDAFTARGHYAVSLDLLPTEALSQAVQYRGDFGCYDHPEYATDCEACEHDEPWCHRHDAHAYECACLGPTEEFGVYADDCERGARHVAGDLFGLDWEREQFDLLIAHPPCTRLTNSGVRWLHERNLWDDMHEAADLFRKVLELPVPKVAVENPIPHRYALERIGRKYSQVIQPWQFGHGETKATCLWLKRLPPLVPTKVVHGREARIHKLPPGPDRWKLRSVTYQGIADAMAEQWGALLPAAA